MVLDDGVDYDPEDCKGYVFPKPNFFCNGRNSFGLLLFSLRVNWWQFFRFF